MVDQCIVLNDGSAPLTELCGISVLERLLRTLQRCGIRRATVLTNPPGLLAEHLARPSWARAELKIEIREHSSEFVTVTDIADAWPAGADAALVVRADVVFDVRLIRRLIGEVGNRAMIDSAVPAEMTPLVVSASNTNSGTICGAAVLKREWLSTQSGRFEEALLNALDDGAVAQLDVAAQPVYDSTLRRKLRPFWFVAPSLLTKKSAERILLESTQKGALDIPAWLHAPIEKFLVSYLCRTSITPNQLTIFCNVVAWMATILFATGHLASGIVIALIVGVLDGLDGKQARLKVETTKRGKLEHWFDGIFEWSWWTALAYQFQISGQLPGAFHYWLLLAVAEAIDAIAKGAVLFKTGKLIDELNTFERIVRLVGGRRNIYVWILAIGILFGAPAKAFVAMIWLEAITAAVHLPHAAFTVYKARQRSPVAGLA
jgi:1L-myo-inositol 1-phosphate cytidylyltransferase / CDP-L-myo-inositol myo-inositolphosphotransferase